MFNLVSALAPKTLWYLVDFWLLEEHYCTFSLTDTSYHIHTHAEVKQSCSFSSTNLSLMFSKWSLGGFDFFYYYFLWIVLVA